MSDGFNNETIIAAKGNGKEVVLAAKSGKIFEFQPVGGDSPNIRTVSLLSPAPLKDALLDYDDSAGVWVVAAVSENGSIEAGSLNNIVSLNVSGTIDDFACANGECLLSTNSAIYSFSEVNPSLRASLSFRALRGIPEILRFTQDDNPSLRGASAASNEAISNNQPFSVSIGKAGNVLIVGAVEKTRSTSSGQAGSAYSGSIFKYSSGSLQSLIINDQSLFSSDYPGTIHFGYDSENDKILAVYAAYVGQAKLFPLSSLSSSSFSYTSSAMLQHSTESLSSSSYDDYSSFFPQRVMEGMTKGEVRFEPELFFKNGVWWAGPSAKSQVQKIVRIENGVTNDITDSIADDKSQSSIINNQSSLLLASGFGDRQIYIIASGPNATKIFLLTDNGFETKNKVVWESSNLNQWNKQLTGGTIVRADADENRGTLNYFLSADGGQNWLPAKLGEAVVFPKGKTEKDFRYRIELSPGSSQFQSPWVDAIEVEYSVAPQ